MCSLSAHAEDWPGWLGPRRDSSSSETVKPWSGPLKILWKQAVGEGHSSPVVADGKVFLHTLEKGKEIEAVEAFDAGNGDRLWRNSYERGGGVYKFGNGPRGTPLVHDGLLYTLGITGILTCTDAVKGTTIWSVHTSKLFAAPKLFFGVSTSPLIEGDNVLVNVGGKEASIVAFDRKTGAVKWRSLDDPPSYASPVAVGPANQRQAVFLTGQHLLAVSPKDGALQWKHPFRDAISESSTTPILVGDVLFGSSITLGSIGLKLKGPTEVEKLWSAPGLTCYFATPVPVGTNHLYLIASSLLTKKADLHCLDLATGASLWKRPGVGTYHGSMLRTADNHLLLLEEKGDLVLFPHDAKGYRELARAKVCGNTWAHPALANGRLYIRDAKELICVQLP
jgi:outer membrane protein assembly factor BamB